MGRIATVLCEPMAVVKDGDLNTCLLVSPPNCAVAAMDIEQQNASTENVFIMFVVFMKTNLQNMGSPPFANTNGMQERPYELWEKRH